MYIAINHRTLLRLGRASCDGWKVTTDGARWQYECGMELSAFFCPMSLPPLHSPPSYPFLLPKSLPALSQWRKRRLQGKAEFYAILPLLPSVSSTNIHRTVN